MTSVFDLLKDRLQSRYRLRREIGRGGMGIVFLADDLKHDREVAIKVLHPELYASVTDARFKREIRVLARLQHPHIVPLYDSDRIGDHLYYVMPYIEGESLRDRLQRKGRLELDEVGQYGQQLIRALTYAHDRGVIHRDVKPANILLSNQDALLADFGIARFFAEQSATTLTEQDALLGSLLYASPEQLFGKGPVGPATDLYALGAVLYETLTGNPPIQGDTVQALLARKATGTPDPIVDSRPDVPGRVENAVLRALEQRPEDRFPSTGAFGRELQGLGRAADAQPTWANWHAWMLAIAAAIIAIWAGFALFGRQPPTLLVMPFEATDSLVARASSESVDYAALVRHRLAGVPGVVVIAPGTSAQLADRREDLRAIGEASGAEFVIRGRVQGGPGAGATVQVELLEASSGTRRWDHSYVARTAVEEISIPASIAEAVAGVLGVRLSAPARATLAAPDTPNPDAWRQYLMGLTLYGSSGRAQENLAAAVRFRRATQLDSSFALAFAAMSEAYAAAYQLRPHPAYLDSASWALERSLRLDPELPEAHLAQAVLQYVQGSFQQASVSVRRVLSERPSDHTAMQLAAVIPRRQGLWPTAVLNFERWVALDPANRIALQALGHTHLWMREYAKADAYLARATAVDPHAPDQAYVDRAWLSIVSGQGVPQAEALLQEGIELTSEAEILSQLVDQDPTRLWFTLVSPTFGTRLAQFGLDLLTADSAAYYLASASHRARMEEPIRAEAYYDSARIVLEARLSARPDNPSWHSYLGIALAGVGLASEAIAAGGKAVALKPLSQDAFDGSEPLAAIARIHVMLGDYGAAVEQLSELLSVSSPYSLKWVLHHPFWEPVVRLPQFREVWQLR